MVVDEAWIKLPHMHPEAVLLEASAELFGAGVEEHDVVVLLPTGLAIGIHLIEVFYGEAPMASGRIEYLVLSIKQEAAIRTVGQNEVRPHAEPAKDLSH